MRIVSPEWIAGHGGATALAARLDEVSTSDDEAQTCQVWLRGSSPKRAIFAELYAPLLDSDGPSLRVLDIGGGLTGFTRVFAERHDYHLVDLLVHDERDHADRLQAAVGRDFVTIEDWFTASEALVTQDWDLVIANDLFPNVDQRLTMFLDRFLPCAKAIATSLTFYPDPRFYVTKRIDADEMLTLMAWDHWQLGSVMGRYSDYIQGYDPRAFETLPASSYANGRQVCLVQFAQAALMAES